MNTLQKMGQITFEFVGNSELMEVHVFRADDFHGEPTESDGRWKGRKDVHSLLRQYCSLEMQNYSCQNPYAKGSS